MPDVFLSGDLIFNSTEAAREYTERLSRFSSDAPSQRESREADYQIDSVLDENRYVSVSLEVFDSFNLTEFTADAERAGASALLLTQFDESQEDVVTLCRKDGQTARPSAVQKLIEREAPGYRAYELINVGKTENLKKLLDNGLSVESRVYKQTLLVMAARQAFRYPEMVELLLERGADPNAVGCSYSWEPGDGEPEYVTPLILVTKLGSEAEDVVAITRAMRALLDAGADPEYGGSGAGITPLQSAIASRGVTQVEILLEAGVDPEGVSSGCSVSSLSLAVEDHQSAKTEQGTQILRLLIQAGVNTTITDRKGQAVGDAYDLIPELADWVKQSK